MARKHRQEEAGRYWHVVARGIARRKLFADDADCQVYLVMLRGVLAVYGWRIYAYCLMGNHIHLIVQTPLPNLAAGMQHLHGHYATYFNRRHDLSGHVFEARYRPTAIETQAHLHAAIAYVGNNPVEAGLCARPEDWLRSSFSTRHDRYIELTAVA